MKLHEFQAKDILSKHGVPVPKSKVARTASEAATAAFDMGGTVVVKAQVHAGGRGKAGGVKIVDSPGAAEQAASNMLGTNLVTFQTGPEGVPIHNVLVEEGIDIERELYLGMVIDGATKGIVVIASESGGMILKKSPKTSLKKSCKFRLTLLWDCSHFKVAK